LEQRKFEEETKAQPRRGLKDRITQVPKEELKTPVYDQGYLESAEESEKQEYGNES
jgi:hypothetical protein